MVKIFGTDKKEFVVNLESCTMINKGSIICRFLKPVMGTAM